MNNKVNTTKKVSEKKEYVKWDSDPQFKNYIDNSIYNLVSFRDALKLDNKGLSKLIGKSAPSIGGYINTRKLMPTDFLISLMNTSHMKNFEISIDDFLNRKIDFHKLINHSSDNTFLPDKTDYSARKRFVGTYLVYYFNQTHSKNFNGLDYDPQFRYGVLHFFEGKYTDKNDKLETLATFFDDLESAEIFKRRIEEESNQNVDKKIIDLFKLHRKYYEGELILTNNRAFIMITCNNKKDYAMFVLQTPSKYKYNHYIGGISTLNSTAHGALQLPTIQKAIFSKYSIKYSNEEIAQHLKLKDTKIEINEELSHLIKWMKNLYTMDDNCNQNLTIISDEEKLQLLKGRLITYIKNQIQNSSHSYSYIDSEDDQRCYKLIKINSPVV